MGHSPIGHWNERCPPGRCRADVALDGLPDEEELPPTEEQSQLVTGLGCELGQGYLYARPLPVADVDAWLQASALSTNRAS